MRWTDGSRFSLYYLCLFQVGSNVASCVCLQVQQPAVTLSEQSLCGASTSITTMTPTITVWLVSSNSAPTIMLIKD